MTGWTVLCSPQGLCFPPALARGRVTPDGEAAALLEGTGPSACRGVRDERYPRTERGKHPTAAADRKSRSVLLPAGRSPVDGASAHTPKHAEGFVPGFFIFVNCVSDEADDVRWILKTT